MVAGVEAIRAANASLAEKAASLMVGVSALSQADIVASVASSVERMTRRL